jgi:hypothetical protein
MRIRVLANVGGDKRPSGIEVLAVAAHNILLDVGKIGLAASDTAWSWFAKQVLHALGDEEGDNQGERKASPALLPLPELARDHCLARKATCGARTWYQSCHNEKDDDRRNDQGDDREQADGNLLFDHRVGDAQVHQRERPLEGLDIINAGANSCDKAFCTLVDLFMGYRGREGRLTSSLSSRAHRHRLTSWTS